MFNSPAGDLANFSRVRQSDTPTMAYQGNKVQMHINTALGAALSGYYPRGTVDTLLSGKQPTITEGSLSQSKIQNLTNDLAAKVSTQQLTDAIAI